MSDIFDLDPEIIEDIRRMASRSYKHSEILRHVFNKYGEVSPPVMAHYYKTVYGLQALDYLPAIASWWPDSTSDISDEELDRLLREILVEKH